MSFAATFPAVLRARADVPICLREKIAAVALGILIVQLPWYLGGINIVAQFINLGLALLAFAVLFIPLKDPLSPKPLDNFKNLLKFPVFWLGLVFLAYLLIQYFNPHIEFCRGVQNGKGVWWVQKIPYVTWLPSGLDSPYYPMNALRFFVMWCTPLLMMCVCKLAIRRRRTWYALLWVCVLNACVISIIGIAVRASDSNSLLWLVGPFPQRPVQFPQTFFGPFVYANHAGMFLYLNIAASLALFLHLRKQALDNGDRSGRYWISAVPILILAGGVFSTGSRMSLAAVLILCICALLIILYQAFHDGGAALIRAAFVFALLGIFLFGVLWFSFQKSTPFVVERMRIIDTASSFKDRLKLIQISSQVAQDRLLWGWGAGSFSYVSQPYLKKSSLFSNPYAPKTLARYLAHSHCDWIEFSSDVGLLGCLPLVGIGLYWLTSILRYWRTLPKMVWMLLAAVSALAVHAAIDFPLSAPAIQVMLALLVCAAAFLSKAASPART